MFCLWWVPVVKYFSIEYGLYRLLASPRHMTAGWIERLKDENDSDSLEPNISPPL